MAMTLKGNIAVFDSRLAELRKHYDGKYVVFYDGSFINSFDSFNAAAEHAIKHFSEGPFLIRQVGAPTIIPMPASVAYRPIYAAG